MEPCSTVYGMVAFAVGFENVNWKPSTFVEVSSLFKSVLSVTVPSVEVPNFRSLGRSMPDLLGRK